MWFDSLSSMPVTNLPLEVAHRSRRRRVALLAVPLLVLLLAVLAGTMLAGPGTPLTGQPTSSPAPTAAPVGIGGPAVDQSPDPTPASPLPAVTDPPPPIQVPTPDPTPAPTSLPPERLEGFVWPIRNARISSMYGPRDNGFLYINGERVHDGIDLATWCGDKIRAAHDGVVLYAGRKFDEHIGYSEPPDRFYAYIERIGAERQLPIAIVIDYGNGYRGFYVHLSQASVEAGDAVEAGQVIGFEGATGNATGCHLHYAIIRMDGPWQQVEPSLVENPGYPALVRERVDPLLVLPIPHEHAPRRFLPKPLPPEPHFEGH